MSERKQEVCQCSSSTDYCPLHGRIVRDERKGYYVIAATGRPICPGVVCKCDQPGHFCPMHGQYWGQQ